MTKLNQWMTDGTYWAYYLIYDDNNDAYGFILNTSNKELFVKKWGQSATFDDLEPIPIKDVNGYPDLEKYLNKIIELVFSKEKGLIQFKI